MAEGISSGSLDHHYGIYSLLNSYRSIRENVLFFQRHDIIWIHRTQIQPKSV